MKLLKEFSYTDIVQRQIVLCNTFLTFFVLSLVYTSIVYDYNLYFVYKDALKHIAIGAISGLFLGNLIGKTLLATRRYRLFYIMSEAVIIIASLIYLIKSRLVFINTTGLNDFFLRHEVLIPVVSSVVPFFTGLKFNYFLKISCGNFIDDKKGTIAFLACLVTGFISGIAIFFIMTMSGISIMYVGLTLIAPLLGTVFFVRLPYTSMPQYTQETREEMDKRQASETIRDDIYFTFLNFSFLIVYLYLGYLMTVRLYGNQILIQYSFLSLTGCAIIIGFLVARYIKNAFWVVYSEMLFPVAFLLYLVLVNIYGEKYNGAAIILFIPSAIIFGFSVYTTVNNILGQYDHQKRFTIINFSLFILPVPILVALTFIQFSNMLYYLFLYLIMILNVLLPGIHLMQRDINAYKKIIYLVFSLVFIPAIIALHLYFSIPFDKNLFVTHTRGYNQIYNRNYNSLYLGSSVDVYYHRVAFFDTSESTMNNLQRALFPPFMYSSINGREGSTLIIDGNQKFFRNPMIGNFKEAKVIDYLPERIVDYNTLPLSGRHYYLVDQQDAVSCLVKSDAHFHQIVDIPNLFDQACNRLRFTDKFYSIAKQRLEKGGVFSQIINLNYNSPDLVLSMRDGFRKTFSNTIGFLFSNILVLMGSDDVNTFKFTGNHLSRLKNLIKDNPDYERLFFNEYHVLSHLYFLKSDFTIHNNRRRYFNNRLIWGQRPVFNDLGINDVSLDTTNLINELIDATPDQAVLKRDVQNSISLNSRIFSLFNKAELFHVEREYEKEADVLLQLKEAGRYRAELSKSIERHISDKENSFYTMALKLEKDKNWDEAKRVYLAMLKINDNNFDANYRIGLLCLTLQNINESFEYMQKAMRIKKDDQRVQYQMGVLLFSSGKAKEAIDYFNRSITLNNDSASVFFYLGLAYEKTGNIFEAKSSYEKALVKDPADSDIKSSLDRIQGKIEEEQNKWKQQEPANQNEDERGERIPLPIQKSAYDWRISDEEAKKLKKSE